MGAVIDFPIRENQHIQDYIKTLNLNKSSTNDFMALLTAVESLEKMLVQSEKNMAEMQKQLSELKEIQKHPIKTELNIITNAIGENVGAAKSWLADLKEKIVNFCKKTLENVKEVGVSALDKTASLLKLQDSMEAIVNYSEKNNKLCGEAINKIEAFTAEYHKVGRAFSNMGRIMAGKEPIDAVKENGKLSKAITAPYRLEKSLWAKVNQKAYVMARDLGDFHTRTQIKSEDKQEAQEAIRVEKSQKTDIFQSVVKHKESVGAKKKDRNPETKKSKDER